VVLPPSDLDRLELDHKIVSNPTTKMLFFASDPTSYLPAQTGWHWLFTPIKGQVTVYGWGQPSPAPWLWRLSVYDWLDLRVAAIDVILLLALMFVIPWLIGRRSHLESRRKTGWQFASVAAGVLFGLIVAAQTQAAGNTLGQKPAFLIASITLVSAAIASLVIRRYSK